MKTKIKAWAIIPSKERVWFDMFDMKVSVGKKELYPLAIFFTKKEAIRVKNFSEKWDKKEHYFRGKKKVIPITITYEQ